MRVLLRALLATAAIAGLVSTASAADLAYKARPPVMVAPAYSWTGFYGGVYGGASTSNSSSFGIDPSTPNTGGVGFGPVT